MRKFLRDKAPTAEPEKPAEPEAVHVPDVGRILMPQPTEVPAQPAAIAMPTVGRILLYTPSEGPPIPALVVHVDNNGHCWCHLFDTSPRNTWHGKGLRVCAEPTPGALHWPPRV